MGHARSHRRDRDQGRSDWPCQDTDLQRLSKRLSRKLRHNAGNQLVINEDGFAKFQDVVAVLRVTPDQICDVVEDWSRRKHDERRFEVCDRAGTLWIRATSGHSVVNVKHELVRASPAGVLPGPDGRSRSHVEACAKARRLLSGFGDTPPQEEPRMPAAPPRKSPASDGDAPDLPGPQGVETNSACHGGGEVGSVLGTHSLSAPGSPLLPDAPPGAAAAAVAGAAAEPSPPPPPDRAVPTAGAPPPPPPRARGAVAQAAATPPLPPPRASRPQTPSPPGSPPTKSVTQSRPQARLHAEAQLMEPAITQETTHAAAAGCAEGYLRFKPDARFVPLPPPGGVPADGWAYGYVEGVGIDEPGWFPPSYIDEEDEEGVAVANETQQGGLDEKGLPTAHPERSFFWAEQLARSRVCATHAFKQECREDSPPVAPTEHPVEPAPAAAIGERCKGAPSTHCSQPLRHTCAASAHNEETPAQPPQSSESSPDKNSDRTPDYGLSARMFVQDPECIGAVKKLENVIRGERILDICCGAGLLSCVCASLGATRVDAIASSAEALQMACAIVDANALQNTVAVTRGVHAEMQDASCTAGVALAGELLMDLRLGGRLVEWLDIRGSMRPGCRMIPSVCTLYVCAADYSAEAAFAAGGEGWRRCGEELGLNLLPLGAEALPQVPARRQAAAARDEALPALLEAVPSDRVASAGAFEVAPLGRLQTPLPQSIPFCLELRPDRFATAIVLYLDALLTDPSDGHLHPVALSAAPKASGRGRGPCCGRQVVLHLPAPGPPLKPLVLPGYRYAALEGTLSMEAAGGLRAQVSYTARPRAEGGDFVAASATYELPA